MSLVALAAVVFAANPVMVGAKLDAMQDHAKSNGKGTFAATITGTKLTWKLTFKNLTTKVKGKTVGYQESFACKKGKRPYVVQYTSVENGVKETPQRVAGSAKC